MRGTLQLSSRKNYERPISDIGNHNPNQSKDSNSSYVQWNYAKVPFRAEMVNTESSKNKSPDILKAFLNGRHTPQGKKPSNIISNLRCQLSNLKQEVTKLTVFPHQPLEFRPKHKHDRSDSILKPNQPQNKDWSFNLQNRQSKTPIQSTILQNDRRDLQKLRSQTSQKEGEIAELIKKVNQLDRLSKLERSKREQLEVEAAAAKNTCQQFKEQADRLREEMRVAAEKERAMFHEKRELIERLHVQRKGMEELERKIQELAVKSEKQSQQRNQEIIGQNQTYKALVAKLEYQKGELEKQCNVLQLKFKQLERIQKDFSLKEGQQKIREDSLKRKDNEITFLKQEIANLHQIISTRVAELNSIQEKGKANDKILAKKDEEVARLTKSLSDTKERLQEQKAFSSSLFDKLKTKQCIIQTLSSDNNNIQNDLKSVKQQLKCFKQKSTEIQNVNGLIVTNLQKSQREKLRLEGEHRACSVDIERLKNSERIAWEKFRCLQAEIEKTKIKESDSSEKERMFNVKLAQKQHMIKNLSEEIQRYRRQIAQLKTTKQQLNHIKGKQTSTQLEFERIRKTLEITQTRNQELLENLKQKSILQKKFHNAQECLQVLQTQIDKKNHLEKLLLDQNSNYKKRQSSLQQQLRSVTYQLNQLSLADKHSQRLNQQIQSLKNQLQVAKSKNTQLQQQLKRMSLCEKTAIELVNDSKTKINVMAEEILKLKSEVRNLIIEKDELMRKVKEQVGKPVVVSPVTQNRVVVASSASEKALRDECSHKDTLICDLHIKIGNLQNTIQTNQATLKRLQKTEEVLMETNELIARLRLKQLQNKYQKHQIFC